MTVQRSEKTGARPKKTRPAPTAIRVAAYRRRSVETGGRQVAVQLSADAAVALAELVEQHGTIRAAVEHALLAQVRQGRKRA